MRSIFGWDLPPGCNASDIPGNGPEGPCALCGESWDSCKCPECPECGDSGCLRHVDLGRLQQLHELLSYQYFEINNELTRRAQEMKQKCPTCGEEYTPNLFTGDPLWCTKCEDYVL